jgi:hypothetical protein
LQSVIGVIGSSQGVISSTLPPLHSDQFAGIRLEFLGCRKDRCIVVGRPDRAQVRLLLMIGTYNYSRVNLTDRPVIDCLSACVNNEFNRQQNRSGSR